MKAANVLFVGAHPDDLEILCGGTIRECIRSGCRVWMAVATNGNVGSPTLGREETAATRRREAQAAAERLEVHGLIWMNEDDEFLFENRATRLKFIDAIRKAQADVIVTHNPNDYHPDHLAVSTCVTNARIPSSVRLIETGHPHLESVPELFYMDSIAGIGFLPQYSVDISSSFEVKMEALRCHESQNAWIQTIFKHDLLEIAKVQSSFRGMQAGVRYAEVFSRPDYWPRKTTGLPFLSPLTPGSGILG